MDGLGPGTSMIYAEGPNVVEIAFVSTNKSSRGSILYQALSLASKWYANLLSQGNMSKVNCDLSSPSVGNLSGRILLRVTFNSGSGSSYHSIAFRRPRLHIFFSNSFSLCKSSCLTPVAHKPLFTPHNIFLGDDSQHCNSFSETLTLFFRRSTFTDSISLCMFGKAV